MIDDLPEIVLPEDLPAWLIDGHSGTDDPAYAKIAIATGHTRIRRVFRRPPIKRKVAMLLTEAQTLQFERWFEQDLLVGQRMFSARVRDMGPGHLWYAAQFAAPYEAEYQHWSQAPGKAHWAVTADLILYGVGEDSGPELSPFQSSLFIALNARGAGAGPVSFSSSVLVELAGISANRMFSSAAAIALTGSVSATGTISLYNSVNIALGARATPTRTTLFSAQIEVALL